MTPTDRIHVPRLIVPGQPEAPQPDPEPAKPSPEEVSKTIDQISKVVATQRAVAANVYNWTREMKRTFKGIYSEAERARALRAMQRREARENG